MTLPWYGILAIGVVALAIIVPAIKVVWQYERGVHFRLGRLRGERDPGLNIIIPYIDSLRKIDMRVETMVVEPQEVTEAKFLVILNKDQIKKISTPLEIAVVSNNKTIDVIKTSFLGRVTDIKGNK